MEAQYAWLQELIVEADRLPTRFDTKCAGDLLDVKQMVEGFKKYVCLPCPSSVPSKATDL